MGLMSVGWTADFWLGYVAQSCRRWSGVIWFVCMVSCCFLALVGQTDLLQTVLCHCASLLFSDPGTLHSLARDGLPSQGLCLKASLLFSYPGILDSLARAGWVPCQRVPGQSAVLWSWYIGQSWWRLPTIMGHVNHHKWFMSQNISNVEELETLCAGTN